MRIRRSHEAVKVLNVTPLIDVVFILLVFFMLATNFASYRLIRVETPRETEVIATSEGAIVILIQADGGLSFDGNDIERDALETSIRDVVAIDPTRVFLVRPEEGVPLQDAINIYDAARLAGASSLSFSPPGEGEGGS